MNVTTPSQLIELQRANIRALSSIGNALVTATEKLSHLNIAASRKALDGVTETAQSLSGVKDPSDLLAVSGASAQPSFERLVGYTRDVVGIANGVSAEIAKVVEQQIAEGNRRIAEVLDYASKNAPAGSEQAVAMLRGAVAAANSAFDTTSKVTRQANDWAQANFATAAKAASSAIAAASNAASGKVPA
ncbi:MAG: phasin family protein [Burkholderiaceae bacterium]|nr:phasin family protein [Burkholderiaceae bacterium]